MRTVAITAAALAALTLAGCKVPDDSKTGAAQPPDAASSSGPANNRPDATAKLTGTCDYSLSDTMDGRDTFTAEVHVKNTGNIGIKIRVTASWPQFGFGPLKSNKTVTVPYRKTVTIRFQHPASSEQTLRLQSWQEHHDMKDGCDYKGKILETSGQPH